MSDGRGSGPAASEVRFRFGLTPLERVEPWGAGRRLHWFGLTDGWYGIDVGGHELLRYSERTVRELRGDGPSHPYVDYYVVRLWEDVLALVSGAMEPVPADLAGIAAEVSPEWTHIESVETPAADAALAWHGAGYLYTGYLRVAPTVRFWRTVTADALTDADADAGTGTGTGTATDADTDTVTFAWRHEPDPEGVIEFAGSPSGRVTVPTRAFLGAVTGFDRALLAAMEQRIGALEEFGGGTGTRLDVGELRREHRERALWLPRALDLSARAPGTEWAAVRNGLQALLGRAP